MAKIAYDVSDLDPEDSAKTKQYETPPIGVYPARIASIDAEEPENKDRRLHLIVEITKPAKNNYPQLHEYINLVSAAAAFKLDQFLLAMGLATKTKRKGEFDTDKLKGKTLSIRVSHETYTPPGGEPQVRARVGSFLPASKSGIAGAETNVGGKAKAESADEEIDLVMHGAAADEEDEESQAFLADKAEAAGLDPDTYDTWAELATALEEAETEAGGEEEEEEEGGEEEDDLEALGVAADAEDEEAQAKLADLAETAGLDPDDFELWAELAEALGGEEGGGEEGEAEDYEAMAILDLKKLAKEREIATTGTKAVLIERLQKYDAEDPFTE